MARCVRFSRWIYTVQGYSGKNKPNRNKTIVYWYEYILIRYNAFYIQDVEKNSDFFPEICYNTL